MVPLEGPVGVGALIDAIFLGCFIVQSCIYYKNYRANGWLLNVLVSLILFFLLSHLGCTAAWLWANNQANNEATLADYAVVLFGISNIFGAAILFSERCFFAHHILTMSNNHLLAFVFFVFCIFSFTAALGAACIFFTITTADLTRQLSDSWIFLLVFISGLVTDLAINIATAVCLRYQAQMEMADALGRTARFFLLVAETGTVASVFDIAAVLVYLLTKSNLAWVGLLVSMPGVFANIFLTALNARGHICADIRHQRTLEIGESLIDGRRKKPPIKIIISKQVEKLSEKAPV